MSEDETEAIAEIKYCEYDKNSCEVKRLDEITEIPFDNKEKNKWIKITSYTDQILKEIASKINVSYYFFNEIMNSTRPSVEKSDSFLIFTFKKITFQEKDGLLKSMTVKIIIGESLVVSLSDDDVFEKIEAKLLDEKDKIREYDAGYLVYMMINHLIDDYFIVVDQISHEAEKLQQQITSKLRDENISRINVNRRKILFIQKNIQPLIRVINRLEREEFDMISKKTYSRLYFLKDQILQVSDDINSLKELLSHLIEIDMSYTSNRMNDIMRLLTVLGAVFYPLTFITGLYGMNFRYMPELDNKYAYPIVLSVMLVLAALMFGYFKRKKWI